MTFPSKDLVGQNAKLVEGVYSDDYMSALNKFATVDDIFGEQREAIAKGECNSVARLIMGTLGHFEYEFHLVSLVMTAAKEGEWRAIERGLGWERGLEEVTKKNFGYVVNHEDKTFLLPSHTYLQYCNERK